MDHPLRGCIRKQSGSAAVELALLCPLFVFLFAVPVFYGALMMDYERAFKAAEDATRYLSTISEQEMREPDLAIAAAEATRAIVMMELADMGPRAEGVTVEVFCGTETCAGVRSRPLPDIVRVRIAMDVKDRFMGLVDTGRYGLPITIDMSTTYLGQ